MSHLDREYLLKHIPDGESLALVIVKLGMPYVEMLTDYHEQEELITFEVYLVDNYPDEAEQIVTAAPYLTN